MQTKNLFSVILSLLIMAALVALLNSCSQPESNEENENFKLLETNFKNPPKGYRPAPLWVWNDRMNTRLIDSMLFDLKEKGFGGAFVHPRPGLVTEYLSDEWFDLFKHSVGQGKKLGLNIWIYDENSYPSGFAGGHVPDQMPESYNQGQGLKMKKMDILPDTLQDFYICLIKSGDQMKEITAEADNYKGKPGTFYVFRKTYYKKTPWYGGFSYVDLIYPGVTQKFIDITMTGYQKIAGDDFGGLIPGIFTDEPEIPSPGGMRWTPDLFEVFQQKWGYDLKTSLPSLYEHIGDWKKIRHDYNETLLQLFIDRWSKPWFEYCRKNDLLWTGHYWEHGWPDLAKGADNMAMYAWHQMPAIDMLFNQFNESSPNAQFGNIRSVKELRSVANQLGYKRTLCETYGGGGWDETFQDFKRLGDWTYVLGINFMNQHLVHSTLKGARKYDYPPVFTYHSPWWPNYKLLNDYFGRLSVALSNGEQINDILIIEPNSTLWNYYSYTQQSEELRTIGQQFQNLVTRLEKSQVEYDLGSENIIKDRGSVEHGKFRIGQRAYGTVVIPGLVENMEKSTFILLQKFVEQGGKIITFSVPERLDGSLNKELADFFTLPTNSIVKIDSLKDSVIYEQFSNPDIVFQDIESGNLFHHRRIYQDGQLVFFVNSSLEESTSGSFKMKGKSIAKMDLFSGGLFQYPFRQEGDELLVQFDIAPAGSLLLFIYDEDVAALPGEQEYTHRQVVETSSKIQVFPLRENAMKVDFCDLHINEKVYRDIYFSNAAGLAFKEYGFEGNPWNTSVQYKQQTVDRDTFKTGGFKVIYNFTVHGSPTGKTFRISAERPEIFSVKINGNQVSPIEGEWFLDKSFAVYDVSRYVKSGKNEVNLEVGPMSVFAEIEPIYVLGDFSVEPAEKGWIISTAGPQLDLEPWGKQGLPFYSWEVAYQRNYQISDRKKHYKVEVDNWQGTVVEVIVNNKKAGVVAFEPYHLDISDYIFEGENNIEVRVVGSLKNLLGPHFKNPEPGLASPWHWKNIEADIPGKEYQMKDYGLTTEFKLVSYE